jgi:hypothetical protein
MRLRHSSQTNISFAYSFEAPRELGKLLPEGTTRLFYYTFNTSLMLVLVLHAYWFYLILKIIRIQISSGGKVDDVRSGEGMIMFRLPIGGFQYSKFVGCGTSSRFVF